MEGLISQVVDFFQYIWDWFTSGIYEFSKDFLKAATKVAIYAYFQSMLLAIEVGYEVFQELMSNLGVSQTIHQYWGSVDSDVRSLLSFFGIPDAVNMLTSAIGTRFVMRFIPFIGR